MKLLLICPVAGLDLGLIGSALPRPGCTSTAPREKFKTQAGRMAESTPAATELTPERQSAAPTEPPLARPGSWPASVDGFRGFVLEIDSSGRTIREVRNLSLCVSPQPAPEAAAFDHSLFTHLERVLCQSRYLGGGSIQLDGRFFLCQTFGSPAFCASTVVIVGQFTLEGNSARGVLQVRDLWTKYSFPWQAKREMLWPRIEPVGGW